MAILVPDDLAPFADIEPAKADAMIEDAEAMAALAAPCITEPEFAEDAALLNGLKAILRRAILRWHEAGAGMIQQIGVGPFQQTTAQGQNAPRSLFWPSEVSQLRDLCATFRGGEPAVAFSIDVAPVDTGGTLASRPDLWFQWVHPTPDDAL